MKHALWTAILLSLLALTAPSASAQDRGEIYVFYPHTGVLEKVPPERLVKSLPVTESIKTGGVTWNLTYEDVQQNNGRGFAGPNGAQARATLSAVLAYIGSVITNTGTADILIQASETDGTGFLAISGSYFFLNGGGFSGGFVHDHVINAVDPAPGSAYDGNSRFDFGFNWHFDHTTPPAAGELDFFSVALHEMTHALGFLSLTGASGASTISSNIRSLLDRDMETGNGKDLFANGGAGAFLGTASDLAGQGGGLVVNNATVVSAYGGKPPLYAPSPFTQGTSLSHYDFSVAGAVMHPWINSGVMKRAYSYVEVATLAGLGFSVATLPSPTPTPSPTVSLTPTPSGFCDNIVYQQSFESGLSDWGFAGSQQGLWHVASSCQAALPGHQGVKVFAYNKDADCTYDTGATNFGYAYSNLVDLTNVAPPIYLSFNYFLQTEGDLTFDLARFDITKDLFATYTTIAQNNGKNLVDPSGGWRSFSADISQFAGQKIKMRLLFATGDEKNNAFGGWSIDDITICSAAGFATPTPTMTPTPALSPSPSPVLPNGADVLVQSLPARLRVGQRADFYVGIRNSGTADWTSGVGYSLAVVGDACQMVIPAGGRIPLPIAGPVASGQSILFYGSVQAPASPGVCDVGLRMVQEFVEFFGQTAQSSIEVYVPTSHDAELGAMAFPKGLAAGQTLPFTLTLINAGSDSWSRATGYSLSVVDDPCGLVNSAARRLDIDAAATVSTNASYVFTGTVSLLPLVAPGAANSSGMCRVAFQMQETGTGSFGPIFERLISASNAAETWAEYQ